jgi:hypothetical protein
MQSCGARSAKGLKVLMRMISRFEGWIFYIVWIRATSIGHLRCLAKQSRSISDMRRRMP